MYLSNLRYFLAAVEEKNISRAADKMYVSRQALSKTIKRLEECVGAELIVPSAQGIQLTEKGEIVYDAAKQILEVWDAAMQKISPEQLNTSLLRVGYGHNSYNLWPGDHRDQYMKQHPEVKLQFQSLLPDQLLKELHDNRLDLVVSNARPRSSEYFFMPILSRPMYVLICDKDPLAEKETVTPWDLNERNILFIPSDQTGVVNFSHLMEGYGLTYHPLISPDSTITTICNELTFRNGVFITSAIFWKTSPQQELLLKPFETGIPHSFYNLDINIITRRMDAKRQDILQYVQYLKEHVKDEFKAEENRNEKRPER